MSAPGVLQGRLENLAGVLGVALTQWAARDDAKAQPEIRRAASTAVDALDAMLRELHAARAVLVTEIRRSDGAAMARTEVLLDEPQDDEPGSAEYDPGPEVDDEGGMSEYRYILPEDYGDGAR